MSNSILNMLKLESKTESINGLINRVLSSKTGEMRVIETMHLLKTMRIEAILEGKALQIHCFQVKFLYLVLVSV